MPGKYCCVQGCNNTTRNSRNQAFFSLPPDEERRREWLTAIGREDLLQREHLKFKSFEVCDAHFEKSSIKIIKRLKDGAMPTRRLPRPARPARPAAPARDDTAHDDDDDHDDKTQVLITIEYPVTFQDDELSEEAPPPTSQDTSEIKMEVKSEPDDDEPAPPPATQARPRPSRKRKIKTEPEDHDS